MKAANRFRLLRQTFGKDLEMPQTTIFFIGGYDWDGSYLYIDKNSNYRFGDDDKIPHKYSKGDVYATNTMEELYVEGNIMHLKMNTTGVTMHIVTK